MKRPNSALSEERELRGLIFDNSISKLWLCSRFSFVVGLTVINEVNVFGVSVKVLANKDTLLLMMLLGLRKLGNICCGHKMFLNKIRNIFCVPGSYTWIFSCNLQLAT